MSKSPEEYFQEQNFSPTANLGEEFSPKEQAFMEKYMGLSSKEALETLGRSNVSSKTKMPDLHSEMNAPQDILEIIKNVESLQLVAFFLGDQIFALPIIVVQEVIRSLPAAKLPSSPPMVEGILSLRGKITPLLRMREVLEIDSEKKIENKFIIVCRRQSIQIGLLIEGIHTMYHIPQKDILWNVENAFGANIEFVSGLVKVDGLLIGILNVDQIIDSILS